jgi:hypothetical protein
MFILNQIEMCDKGILLVGYEFEYEKCVLEDSRLEYIGHPERLWYAKIDSVGDLQWQHVLVGPGYELCDTIKPYRLKLNTQTRLRDAMQT